MKVCWDHYSVLLLKSRYHVSTWEEQEPQLASIFAQCPRIRSSLFALLKKLRRGYLDDIGVSRFSASLHLLCGWICLFILCPDALAHTAVVKTGFSLLKVEKWKSLFVGQYAHKKLPIQVFLFTPDCRTQYGISSAYWPAVDEYIELLRGKKNANDSKPRGGGEGGEGT